MPTYLLLALLFIVPEFYRPLNSEQAIYIILRISVVTILLPGISISILKLTGYIKNVHLENRQDRLWPYLFTSLYYGVLCYIFIRSMSFHSFLVIMGSMTTLILLLAVFNFKIKISAHAAAITGALGFLWALKMMDPEMQILYPIAIVIFVIGIVMWARLKLNAHRPIEIYLGALLGFLTCYFGVLFFM